MEMGPALIPTSSSRAHSATGSLLPTATTVHGPRPSPATWNSPLSLAWAQVRSSKLSWMLLDSNLANHPGRGVEAGSWTNTQAFDAGEWSEKTTVPWNDAPLSKVSVPTFRSSPAASPWTERSCGTLFGQATRNL